MKRSECDDNPPAGGRNRAIPDAMRGTYRLHRGDVLDAYRVWPSPTAIVSDGAYGVRGFHGDTVDNSGLVDWYAPHIQAWTVSSKPGTALWFWGTEIGWATVHPELVRAGWDYIETVVWDKGIGHIAGNVNGRTIRRFPVVTEVCVLYQRRFEAGVDGLTLDAKGWVRHEWQRSGLPMYRANEAVGVANAATRKYLTSDWLWYWPPGAAVAAMASYCNEHGLHSGRPYFSLDGQRSVTAAEWDALRHKWNHVHGLTNVWSHPPLHDGERLRGSMRRAAPRVHTPTSSSTTHLNQKPLKLMARLVNAVTVPGDVVWEPFGGLATASVAAVAMGRQACVAEIDPYFARLADERLSGSIQYSFDRFTD